MKIDKAIKILSHFGRYGDNVKFKDIKEAVKLGREALKGITAIRCGAISNANEPLPGETE